MRNAIKTEGCASVFRFPVDLVQAKPVIVRKLGTQKAQNTLYMSSRLLVGFSSLALAEQMKDSSRTEAAALHQSVDEGP